jgi:hypothetical protein
MTVTLRLSCLRLSTMELVVVGFGFWGLRGSCSFKVPWGKLLASGDAALTDHDL